MFDRALKLVNKVTSVSIVPTFTTIHTDNVANTFSVDTTKNYVCREQKPEYQQQQGEGNYIWKEETSDK
jgi:hypothetical protein